MAVKKNLRKINAGKVKIFKIANRRGYAGLCLNNLTEGNTTYQVYQRMEKAVKRRGYELPQITADKSKRLIVSKI
ncbi:MAG: hypothetical protein GY853_11320 [PVC group bacterium]|nr:hypothetical protein [PVC group bacterium]